MRAYPPSPRASGIALIVGLALLLGCLLVGRSVPRQGLLSYLFAFVFFTGLSAGSLALLLVHMLTGGAWGDALRTPLLAAAPAGDSGCSEPLRPLLLAAALPAERGTVPGACGRAELSSAKSGEGASGP